MKFEIESGVLAGLARTAGATLGGKNVAAWSNAFYLKADSENNELTIRSTNGEQSIQQKSHCNVEEDGEIMLDGKLFRDMACKMESGMCVLAEKNGKLNVKCGPSKASIALLDAKSFVFPASITPKVKIEVESGELLGALQTVRYAFCTDENRRTLCGAFVNVENGYVNVVGLDGFRMALYQLDEMLCDVEGEGKGIVPSRAVDTITGMLSKSEGRVTLAFDEKNVELTVGDVMLHSSLIAGEYIDYKKIIPTGSTTTIRFCVEEMKKAVDRVRVFSNGKQLMKMRITDEGTTISSNDEFGAATEALECDMQGESLNIAFNSAYFKTAVSSIAEENAVMKMAGGTRPATIVSAEGKKYMHMVLPVRVVAGEFDA